MKLPGVTAVSPFTDMASNYSAAPYVMALYQSSMGGSKPKRFKISFVSSLRWPSRAAT